VWVERGDDNWMRFAFTENSAVKIQIRTKGFDIFLNKDNVHLANEIIFQRNVPADFLREQYKCGMVLACLGLYQSFLKKISVDPNQNDGSIREEEVPGLVNSGCDAIAQVILPIISIGHLDKIKPTKIPEITLST